jgi:UDP-2,3-diacylglucosamine pyrophosphatase LpxH
MQALKQAPDSDEVSIALLGDIVEGENIYPAQEHFLDHVNPKLLKRVFPYLEGLKEASSVYVLLQAYLAAQFIFKEVIEPVAKAGFKLRIASVVGNHGRLIRHHPQTNGDASCYLLLKEMCSTLKSVDTELLGAETFCALPVFDKKVLLYHGHGIPIYHTLPYYGIQRRALGWQATKYWGELSLICIGHFHHCAYFNSSPPIVVNGAFLLDYLYPIEKLGLVSTPKQWLLTLNENGVHNLKLIDLEQVGG